MKPTPTANTGAKHIIPTKNPSLIMSTEIEYKPKANMDAMPMKPVRQRAHPHSVSLCMRFDSRSCNGFSRGAMDLTNCSTSMEGFFSMADNIILVRLSDSYFL